MFDRSLDKEPFQTPKATPRLAPSAETLPIRVMTDASSRIQKSAISIASLCGGGPSGGIVKLLVSLTSRMRGDPVDPSKMPHEVH
jgi:hypothetical protein